MLCVNSLLEPHSYPMVQSLLSDPLYRLQVGVLKWKDVQYGLRNGIVDHSYMYPVIHFLSLFTHNCFSFSCTWVVSEGTLSQALLQGVLFLSLRSITPCVHTSLWAQKLWAFRLHVSQFITYVTNNRQKWHFNLWGCCFFVCLRVCLCSKYFITNTILKSHCMKHALY